MKVHLREWRTEDKESLVKYANNKKIADNMRDIFPNPYTISDAMQWIAASENKTAETVFAIDADEQFVGGCGIHLKEDVYKYSAEIGYWIAEPFWGKGIATETIKLMLEKTSQNFPLIIRVYAEVFEHNKASMRVLEKNGFHLESIRKKAVIKSNVIMDDYVWVKLLNK
ncbi:MAG: GNAT family N-acetyltransferase [Ginsengibacter sp.]